jgi:putative phosphoesterase
MKIGIIADTHIPASAGKLPPKIYEHFKDCDLIIHAGDLVEMSVIEELERVAETKAVWGNMDGAEIRERLPEKILFEAGGKKIAVTHGKGPSLKVFQQIRKEFKKNPDIVIFGHSHVPINETINGVLFFNPGSPTDRIFAPYRSLGIIEINSGKIQAKIIKLED